ncbi:MAG: hypothetical protein V4520_16225 [Bacteroidota bacterium]
MKTEQKKASDTKDWKNRYNRVVREIQESDTPTERNIKEAFYEKIKSTLNGKDLVMENYCK